MYAVRSEMEVADVGRSRRGVFIHPAIQVGPAVLSAGSRRDAQRHDSDSQAGIVMIKSDAQKEHTATRIEGLPAASLSPASLPFRLTPPHPTPQLSEFFIGRVNRTPLTGTLFIATKYSFRFGGLPPLRSAWTLIRPHVLRQP